MFSTRNTRLLGGAAALLIGSALAAVLPTAGAQAAVPGLVQVQAASPNNSVGKSVTVSCPAGQRVVDAGGYITGAGPDDIALDDVTPNAGAVGSVTASAYETDGTGANWRVHAVAECANPLPGQVRVFNTSPNNSANKSVTVTCPAGTNVIGVGLQTDRGLGDVIIDRVAPNAGLTSVTVAGREDGALARNWDIIAYAVCANVLPGQVGVAASPPANSANKVRPAICPAGTVAIGGGGEAVGAGGRVLLRELLPAGNAMVAVADEEDPFAGNWTLITTAICARP
jgi:hypothetical protein